MLHSGSTLAGAMMPRLCKRLETTENSIGSKHPIGTRLRWLRCTTLGIGRGALGLGVGCPSDADDIPSGDGNDVVTPAPNCNAEEQAMQLSPLVASNAGAKFKLPTAMAQLPDKSFLVLEKDGRIKQV